VTGDEQSQAVNNRASTQLRLSAKKGEFQEGDIEKVGRGRDGSRAGISIGRLLRKSKASFVSTPAKLKNGPA